MPSKKSTRKRYVKPLTERQKQFAAELIKLNSNGKSFSCRTLEEAALAAGYSAVSAKRQGSLLYKDPRIKQLVSELREEANKAAMVDRNKVLEMVIEAANKAIKGYPVFDATGKVKAIRIEPCAASLLDILCKCTGAYAEEKISHSINGNTDDGRFGIILNLERKPKND